MIETPDIFFTFDDGNTSDLWAAFILHKFGLRGIFFLNDSVDLEYTVEGLLKYGQIIGNHTVDHTILKGLTNDQIAGKVIPFNEKLKRLGASGEYFSYPTSAGEYNIPILHQTFKYIYRGYSEPMPNVEGEISRVAITDWNNHKLKSVDIMANYPVPLQLHGIESGNWFDLSRRDFLELCKRKTQLKI